MSLKDAEMTDLTAIQDPEVRSLADEAVAFLEGQPWCDKVLSGKVGFAIPGVLGVFLLQLQPSRVGVDHALWVVTGDLPSAYLVCDSAPDWREALARYTEEMGRWVKAVRAGESLEGVIPVSAAATQQNAVLLARRLQYISTEFVNVGPEFEQ